MIRTLSAFVEDQIGRRRNGQVFVYFVTMERELGVLGDWNEFRHGLVSALTAAFGLDMIWLDLPEPVQRRQVQ